MRLEKKILMTAIVTLASFPLLAQAADLVTQNNTAQPSTVRVNSMCVGTLPGPLRIVTPAGGSSAVSSDKVNMVCGGKFRHKCIADIHMTDNCTDAAVAKAYFNLDTFAIETITMTPGVPYRITWSGTNVTINPA